MSPSLRLFVLFAIIGIAWFRLAVVAPAPRPLASADQSVGSFGDARYAAATPVRHTAFSPDGRWLAGTGRGEVRLWEAATGRSVRRIVFGDRAIGIRVAFTPDGRTILVLAFEDVPYVSAPPYAGSVWPITVRRFDPATGAEQDRVQLDGVNAAHLSGRPVAAFTPDGTGVVLGGNSSRPARFDTTTGRKLWVAELPPKTEMYAQHLTSVAVSPDGREVAAAVSNSDGPCHLLDAATGAVLGRLAEPDTDCIAVAYSPDGKRLATAGRGKTVVVWDAVTRTPLKRVATAPLVDTPLALSPTGDRVAVAEYDAGVRVYDVGTGRETARSVDRGHAPTLAFSPDGSAVAAAAGLVVVLDAATGQRRGAVGWSPTVAPWFRFSADRARVHVRTWTRDDLITFELPSGREVARVAHTLAAAAELGFQDAERVVSADGRLAAAEMTVVRGDDRAVVVTETVSGRERCQIPFNVVKDFRSPAWFTPDGGFLVTVGQYEVATWDTATGQRVRALVESVPAAGKLHPFLSVAPSPGGRYLAVFTDAEPRKSSGCGTCDFYSADNLTKTVTIWDAAAWRVVRTVQVPAGSWLLWQTDDRFTVETCARRSAARVDHPLRYDPVPTLGPHLVEEWTVADGRVEAWQFDPPPRELLVPSPDGRLWAGFDPEDPSRLDVRLYEKGTGRVRHTLVMDEPCRSAVFSPDGRYLLTDHRATGVRVWDVRRATSRP